VYVLIDATECNGIYVHINDKWRPRIAGLCLVFLLLSQYRTLVIFLLFYSGAKKYLVSQQLCKFSHFSQMREACNFHHRYTSTVTDKIRGKNPENHIVGFLINLLANYGGK
jgi:hypothetical protein